MVKSAEEYAGAAHGLRALADARNHAEVLASEIELSLDAYYSQIKDSEALAITERIAELRHAIEGLNAYEIRRLTAVLVESAQVLRLGEE